GYENANRRPYPARLKPLWIISTRGLTGLVHMSRAGRKTLRDLLQYPHGPQTAQHPPTERAAPGPGRRGCRRRAGIHKRPPGRSRRRSVAHRRRVVARESNLEDVLRGGAGGREEMDRISGSDRRRVVRAEAVKKAACD